MIEALVSYEIAKTLRAKDFKEILCHFVYDRGELRQSTQVFNRPEFELAPTLSLVQKWLREVHNINMYLMASVEGTYTLWIQLLNKPKTVSGGFKMFEEIILPSELGFKTYEEALEKGLQKALELI